MSGRNITCKCFLISFCLSASPKCDFLVRNCNFTGAALGSLGSGGRGGRGGARGRGGRGGGGGGSRKLERARKWPVSNSRFMLRGRYNFVFYVGNQ